MFIRRIKSVQPISLDGYGSIDTGAKFKQYDVNTSILVMDITFNSVPANLTTEAIFISLKNSSGLMVDKFQKFSTKAQEDAKGVLLKGEIKNPSQIEFILSPLALELSGDIEGEIIIVDTVDKQRLTSQKFKLSIEASLTPNLKTDVKYVAVKDFDGNFITDLDNYELVAPTLEANATAIKLNFTGDEINAILAKARVIDLSKFYTKAETDSQISTAISNIVIPNPDLSNLATITELSETYNYLEREKCPKIHGHDDVYYGKKIIDDKLELKANKDNVYSKAEVNSKLDAKANTVDVFNKTETYNRTTIDDKIANVAGGGSVDLSNYYTKTETYNKTEINELSLDKVDATSFNSETSRVNEELEKKALKSETYNKTEIDASLSNKVSLNTFDKETLRVNAELAKKVNAGEVYSIAETYNKVEVDEKIAGVAGGGTVDLSNYYTKAQVYNKQETNTLVSGKLEVSVFNTEKERVDKELEKKATKLTTYTKTQTEALITSQGFAFADNVYPKTETYNKTEVDAKIAGVSGGGEVDLTGLVTKVDLAKSVTTENLTISKRANVFDLVVGNYFEVGGGVATQYWRAPKIEATDVLLVGTMNVKTEIEALKSGTDKEHRVIPKITAVPVKNEIYIKELAGATFGITSDGGAPTINGDNFFMSKNDDFVVVTFKTDGAFTITVTGNGTGYFNFDKSVGVIGVEGWQGDIGEYTFEGKTGQKVTINQDASTDVGWRFAVTSTSVEELHYNGKNGDKKIAFETLLNVEAENKELKQRLAKIEKLLELA